MLPAKLRAQGVEVSRALVGAVERHGAEWWAIWDGLQLSPVGAFDGIAYGGRDRLTLAALALSRDLGDRRWATKGQLHSHGFQPRHDARCALMEDRDGGIALAYNAGEVVRSRGQGVRHGTTLPDDGQHRPLRDAEIALMAKALASCGLCPVMRDQLDHAKYLPEAGIVAIPHRIVWGGRAAELRELVEALSLSALFRRRSAAATQDVEEALLVATLASAFVLSDLGMAPSEARREDVDDSDGRDRTEGVLNILGDIERLPHLADESEKVAARLTLALAQARGMQGGDRAGVDESAAATHVENSAKAPYVRPPLRKPNLVPYGRYRLRDVVAESEHASEALAHGFGGGWDT